MASREQIEANRKNAKKSTGPRDTGRTRFNGLTHGLCAAHVVLPGENAEGFEAERQGWLDDWRPPSHTRAVLCELAAAATWKLRRAIQCESAMYARLAGDAARAFDRAQDDRIRRTIDGFGDDPRGALALLESDAPGIDRLLRSWGEMAESLGAGPDGWSPHSHARLMLLLGHPPGTHLMAAGPLATASSRLVASRRPGMPPLPAGEAEATVAALRKAVADEMARLRARRESAPDLASDRLRAMAAAAADTSAEARLRHRYEKEHEKSLRWALGQLIALEKSGADLHDEDRGLAPIVRDRCLSPSEEASAGEEAPGGGQAPIADDRSQSPKCDSSRCNEKICGELASVRDETLPAARPGGSEGSPGRPGGPDGADPGPRSAPDRR